MTSKNKKCLLIDNYDSFTFNLYHLLGQINKKCVVKRNDQISLQEIEKMAPEAIILSPGPCTPIQAGICLELIKHFKNIIPIFGVCLGMQAIAMAFGGKLCQQKPVMHGKTSPIMHANQKLFKGIPNLFNATRYHSLSVNEHDLIKLQTISIDAHSQDDHSIMALSIPSDCIYGVQFHPESIASEYGEKLLGNFFAMCSMHQTAN